MTGSVAAVAATAGGSATSGGGILVNATSRIGTSGIATGGNAPSGSATSGGETSGAPTSRSAMSGGAMLDWATGLAPAACRSSRRLFTSMSAGTSSISTIFTGAGSSSMTKSAAASWLAGSAEASSMRSRSGDPGVGVRSGSTAGTTGGSEASPRSCATRSASGTSMAKVSGSRSTGATEAVASGGIAPAPAVGAISTAVRPSSQPGGLNGAGNSSSPGISTGPRAMDAANTSRESWRTISSRGKSSRPLTIRAATSDKGTAKTSGGNWPATTSHSTCTTPSPSWGTMRACGTTSTSRSAS